MIEALQRSKICLGTSGWSYADWVGPFYPPGTPPARYLASYAQHFTTVEIDSTFYGVPRQSMLATWCDRTPADFIFAAKVPRSITHERELHDVVDDVRHFAAAMRQLGPKCGPLLFQFAPSFMASPDRWAALVALLPALPSDLRWAIEVRHTSWLHEQFYELLRTHDIALAHVDLPWMPRVVPVTASFAYLRWLGDRRQIEAPFSYTRPGFERDGDLVWWARQIARMAERNIAVFGYANNHYQGHSPATVRELLRRLQLPVPEPPALPEQRSLL